GESPVDDLVRIVRQGLGRRHARGVAGHVVARIRIRIGPVLTDGDASRQIIQSLSLASSPPAILNVTGPETFSVRQVALKFGEIMGKEVQISGEENGLAYINNATRANKEFGYPTVPLGKVIEWTAHWIQRGGSSLGKPTHFETQDGHY
ncbi:MAG: epimerase, partial [bacterium]